MRRKEGEEEGGRDGRDARSARGARRKRAYIYIYRERERGTSVACSLWQLVAPLLRLTVDYVTVREIRIRCSIVVSISACHAEDPGSIPGGGVVSPFPMVASRTLHKRRRVGNSVGPKPA